MDGNSLLKVTWPTLFYGCVREALAAAHCVARFGQSEARSWEGPLAYVVNNNEGDVGVIEFREDGAACAVNTHTPCRPFDFDSFVRKAPSAQQEFLRRVYELPLLQGRPGVSAMFWTRGEEIELSEDWESALRSGMDLFEREYLSDLEWRGVASEHWGMSSVLSERMIAIARRSRMRAPLLDLTEIELRLLIPQHSGHTDEARKWLFGEGLFSMAQP